jgi:hypothetical protein
MELPLALPPIALSVLLCKILIIATHILFVGAASVTHPGCNTAASE